jgi:DNA modification methylase
MTGNLHMRTPADDGRVKTVRIVTGDCRDILPTLAAESVHCVVTSPPYWRQRDYGVSGQLGLEKTPEEYVDELTAVFREARRVLRGDGTLWLNVGDKWASGGNGGGGSFMAGRGDAWAHAKGSKGWRSPPNGYKDKDLVGIPWMLAFALRADGWWLRQCNIWAKPNCMPESVADRSTVSHEYVFHLSKSKDYWYDSEAARMPAAPATETRINRAQISYLRDDGVPGQPAHGLHRQRPNRSDKQRGHGRRHQGFNERWDAMESDQQMAAGANLRSVWWISPAQYREGHYAVMPDRLAELCIVAGCPEGGTVLDPFGGAGTVGLVADRLGRSAILIEINPAYAAIARERITADAPLLATVT